MFVLFKLPKFFNLCEDGVWGVRNACAECFMQVSTSCSLEVRRTDLAQLFVSLLCDQSRWVSIWLITKQKHICAKTPARKYTKHHFHNIVINYKSSLLTATC